MSHATQVVPPFDIHTQDRIMAGPEVRSQGQWSGVYSQLHSVKESIKRQIDS